MLAAIQKHFVGKGCILNLAALFSLRMNMAVLSGLILRAFATIRLAQAFHPTTGQQRLEHGKARNPGAFGDASFKDFVLQTMDALHVPGLSLAVIEDGQISAEGYGIADLPDLPATPDTLYYTGSTTKAFTAAAIGLLIQDQDRYPGLMWTSPINQFLREDFVLQDDHATTHTTIEDALSHRSGLPRHDLAYGEPDDTPSTVVQRIRHLPMTAESRTTFQYCNIMYAVATDLLESLTGVKLETLLREKFWKPLGMASTSFSTLGGQGRLARGYYWDPTRDDSSASPGRSVSDSPYVSEPYINISFIAGAGATISSVNDYALWIKAYLDVANPTKPTNHSSPINPALYRDVFTPRTIAPLPPEVASQSFITPQLYALGWVTFSIQGHTIVGHGGGLPGFGTVVLFLPDDGYGIVTMGNTAGTSNIVGNLIAQVLLKQKLGLSVEESASAKATLLAALADPDMRRDFHYSSNDHSVTMPRSRRPSAAPPEWPPNGAATLPLPGDIGDFAGLYTHPAYGTINFTVSRSDPVLEEARVCYLSGLPTPTRIWRYALELHHVTDTLFTCKFMMPHGMGSEVIWEHATTSRAVFKLGITGEAVESLGIELEGEMVDVAKRKGGKHWAEGMIWFDRI